MSQCKTQILKLYKILTYIRLLDARCVHKAREKSLIVQLDIVPCVFYFVVVCYSFVGRICGKKEQAGVNWLKNASLRHYISAELSIFH